MPDARHAPNALIIVWGPPHKGPRSNVLAEALGVPAHFLASTWRGGLRDPLKYPRMALKTLAVLAKYRPRVVIVQSPPTFGVWAVAIYAWLRRGGFLVDAHSDAFQRSRWTRPAALNRRVARAALATIVTDHHWANRLTAAGAKAIVVPDIPVTPIVPDVPPKLDRGRFQLLVVNTWAADEPLTAVIDAARDLPQARFHVTGTADRRIDALGEIPPNVTFTGFLPKPDYVRLMHDVEAVVCLTTRDHTMQRGACEALALARPIVTSDWPLLRSYFARGTVHVDNTPEGIRDGIRGLIASYDRYRNEIAELRELRVRDWKDRRAEILSLMLRGKASEGASPTAG